ncbi:MAG: hypothetical protein LBD41_07370, partial [Clostridiales Family XIII bacterium]|nr:hypothetical protein [Clostridiales Family XIII bacterium]
MKGQLNKYMLPNKAKRILKSKRGDTIGGLYLLIIVSFLFLALIFSLFTVWTHILDAKKAARSALNVAAGEILLSDYNSIKESYGRTNNRTNNQEDMERMKEIFNEKMTESLGLKN